MVAHAPGGGNGGSQAGAPVVRGPFSFAFNTPGLTTGVTFYTPTVDDLLIGFALVYTNWDGDAAKFDFGPFVNETTGLASLTEVSPGGLNVQFSGGGTFDTLLASGPGLGENGQLLPITTVDSWKVIVTQDGHINGAASGATMGTGNLYIVTATPVAF